MVENQEAAPVELHHPTLGPSKFGAFDESPCFMQKNLDSKACEDGKVRHRQYAEGLCGIVPEWDLPEEIQWAIQKTNAFCDRILGPGNRICRAEIRLDIRGLDLSLITFGTADFIAYIQGGHRAVVVDLKGSGFDEFSDRDWLQIANYGLGVHDLTGGDVTEIYGLNLYALTQTAREYTLSVEVADRIVQDVAGRRLAALESGRVFPSRRCVRCSRAGDCPATTEAIGTVVLDAPEPVLNPAWAVSELKKDPDALGAAWTKYKKLIEPLGDALKDAVNDLIKSKVKVPGWQVIDTELRKVTFDPDAIVQALQEVIQSTDHRDIDGLHGDVQEIVKKSIGVGDLEELFWELYPGAANVKKKDRKDVFNASMSKVLTISPGSQLKETKKT